MTLLTGRKLNRYPAGIDRQAAKVGNIAETPKAAAPMM